MPEVAAHQVVEWQGSHRAPLRAHPRRSAYDGSFEWERAVADQALSLWSDIKTVPEEHLPTGPLPIDPETGEVSLSVWSTLFDGQKAKQRELARKVWPELADNIAPGWRMLTSLPSCPNAHLRFPMSPAMLRRVRANACA